jgi:hypothetical protein
VRADIEQTHEFRALLADEARLAAEVVTNDAAFQANYTTFQDQIHDWKDRINRLLAEMAGMEARFNTLQARHRTLKLEGKFLCHLVAIIGRWDLSAIAEVEESLHAWEAEARKLLPQLKAIAPDTDFGRIEAMIMKLTLFRPRLQDAMHHCRVLTDDCDRKIRELHLDRPGFPESRVLTKEAGMNEYARAMGFDFAPVAAKALSGMAGDPLRIAREEKGEELAGLEAMVQKNERKKWLEEELERLRARFPEDDVEYEELTAILYEREQPEVEMANAERELTCGAEEVAGGGTGAAPGAISGG